MMLLLKFPENVDDEFKITLLSLLIHFKFDNAFTIFPHNINRETQNVVSFQDLILLSLCLVV